MIFHFSRVKRIENFAFFPRAVSCYDGLEVALENQLPGFLEERLLVLVDVVETVDGRCAEPRDHSVWLIWWFATFFVNVSFRATAGVNSTKWQSSGTISPGFCELQTTCDVNVKCKSVSTPLVGFSLRFCLYFVCALKRM